MAPESIPGAGMLVKGTTRNWGTERERGERAEGETAKKYEGGKMGTMVDLAPKHQQLELISSCLCSNEVPRLPGSPK